MLRKNAKMSQAILAKQLNVSPSTLGSYEQGRREPSCAMLVALSDALGVTTDYLLTGKVKRVLSTAQHRDLSIKVSKQSIELFFSENIGITLVEYESVD